jgi:NADPH-dependent 2,4-dienoyl-CoA reductase/sulfur reductase-like enzyme
VSPARDLVIVGAGPAGMAAAAQARTLGLTVAVLDQQQEPGGQIYRAVERVARTRAADMQRLGEHYRHGLELSRAFRECGAEYLPGTGVWQVCPGEGVHFSDGRRAGYLPATRILVACGALERPLPLPGWTLPGVMAAGAAQILLKTAALVPDGPVVLAGSGPLLLLCAVQLLDAGVEVTALLESTRRRDYLRAAPWLAPALRAREVLSEGLALRRRLRAAGIAMHQGVGGLVVEGAGRAERVRWRTARATLELPAAAVLLHDGVVPHTQLTRQAGCEHEWLALQRHWRPVRDAWGATSVSGVHAAGDCAGILGARVAETQGRLAALDIAFRLHELSRDERDTASAALRGEAARHASVRPLLDRLFPPRLGAAHDADDAVIVCRCEEITAGQIRRAVRLGAMGANQLKAYTRCGMGPCQGRMCQLAAAEIIAAARGVPVAQVPTMRVRPPVLPVSLGELAAMDGE